MTSSQWRCCVAPCTSGVAAGARRAGGEAGTEVGTEEGAETDKSGMGGGTASCTLRAEGSVAAECELRAAPSLCVADGGADSYPFFLHSAVVCVVEAG